RPRRGHRARAGAHARPRRDHRRGAAVQGDRRGEGDRDRAVRARALRPRRLRAVPVRRDGGLRAAAGAHRGLPRHAAQGLTGAAPGSRPGLVVTAGASGSAHPGAPARLARGWRPRGGGSWASHSEILNFYSGWRTAGREKSTVPSSQPSGTASVTSSPDRRYVVKKADPGCSRLSSPVPVHEQLAFLNEASRRIGTTLDIAQTARELVDLAVPRFADWAAVTVRDRVLLDGELPYQPPDGSAVVRRLAGAVAGPRADDYVVAWPLDEVTAYPPWSPFARCMASGKPIMFTEVDPDLAAELSRARGRDDVRRLLEGVSLLMVPLQARGRVLGIVSFH